MALHMKRVDDAKIEVLPGRSQFGQVSVVRLNYFESGMLQR